MTSVKKLFPLSYLLRQSTTPTTPSDVLSLICYNIPTHSHKNSEAALQSDGLIYAEGNNIGYYNRAYAYKQFTSFIKSGMVRVELNDALGYQKDLEKVAFSDGKEIVLVIVNNAEKEKTIKLKDSYTQIEAYMTNENHNCEKISPEFTNNQCVISP